GHLPYAEKARERLQRQGVRVEVDARQERMQRKLVDAHARKAPYIAVVGGREAAANTLALTVRGGGKSVESLDDFTTRVAAEIAERGLSPRASEEARQPATE